MSFFFRPKNNAGLTLLELLIVLSILGVMISFMTLNIGVKPSLVKQEASHLQQLLEFAHEDAILKGQITAWKLSKTQHVFYRYRDQKWLKIENDRILHDYPTQSELEYLLTVDDFETESGTTDAPQILLLPDGSLTDFSLIIQVKGGMERYRIFNRQGKIDMEVMEPRS